MGREKIQNALRQTLMNYQRCGVRWISSDQPLPDSYLVALQKLVETTDAIESGSVADAGVNLATTEPSERSTGRSRPAAASTVLKDERMPSQPLNSTTRSAVELKDWQTAALPDSQRLTVFHELAQQVSLCRLCTEICNFRKQAVFGVGPIRPTVCFMGEAPGADEDRLGEPFVGKAGQLLTRIIGAMQLKREEVYILNSLKCRPPGNRTPSPVEIELCRPFVETQLETLQPKYIVCLGAVAVRSLLQLEAPVGQLRGKFFSYRGAKVIVTYHPSYLLRNEAAKRLVWEDMQVLMRELGIALPNKNS